MPLEFRGLAIIDPKGRDVRFAGYPLEHNSRAIIICRVMTEALLALGNKSDATEPELLDLFENYKEHIFKAASDQYDRGSHRPIVTLECLKNAAAGLPRG